jgi:hypothetical protein
MSSPTLNYTDPTALSSIPPQRKYINNTSIVFNKFKLKRCHLSMELNPIMLNARWKIVFVAKLVRKSVPVKSSIFKSKLAVLALIKTFPPIYRERTGGTRPAEGQLFPRGYK